MKGLTYFKRWGFSINEGVFPNIHMTWGNGLFVYIALTGTLRWHGWVRKPRYQGWR